jgi:hypothetical protein
MPLLPIDLQTMFSQMSQVGREQAAQKDVPPQYQAAQAAELAKKSEHDDKAVNQAREAGEGPEKVREEAGGRGRRRGRQRPESGKEPPAVRSVVEDPALGHNVDLVG